ncbi:efflux RND transporter permease subunit [Elongatibacter sediminis]|uniref:Efflux RND transporter permease subunit n=1 Tax=Elongatibacter sediminis TaxID=3119006 RepID=A0AAW9RF18_9GAMM
MADPAPANRADENFFDRLVAYALRGGTPLTIFIIALLAGAAALYLTPREEEPQIVVPMVDVLVTAPGLSADQVERQVSVPIEKLLTQIPGVEHIYSTSLTGRSSVTLRFHVGEDREKSILNTYTKLYSNQDEVPEVVTDWVVQPVEVDDVPILLLALWSEDAERYDAYELRRLADELSTSLKQIDQSSEVRVTGGRPRTVRILLDPESMAARKTTALEVAQALQLSNQLLSAGDWTFGDQSLVLESGDFIRGVEELRNLVVNVIDGTPVILRDIATVVDGPAEVDQYTWIDFAEDAAEGGTDAGRPRSRLPMVAISIAKHRGSNAVRVARDVHRHLDGLRREVLPPEIHIEVLRDYGDTANEKVNNLAASLGFAIITVVVFIGVFLGLRPALVVGLAVPICYGVTLALDLAFGYTINRVTLFALILSLGLLVDDPITGVDNIERFLHRAGGSLKRRIVDAVAEIRTPLLMSTLTIVLAFVPLAFITGMMGPYMAPMAFNVPVSVGVSTAVAFLVTPWLASRLLRVDSRTGGDAAAAHAGPDPTRMKVYRAVVGPLLERRARARWVLWGVLALFLAAAVLPALRLVPLKLLPYDNKNEVQIVIDMPESSSLERTAALAGQVADRALKLPEVQAAAAFVGLASPMDFNGMVRRYYQRTGAHVADLRLKLIDKADREHQSHAVVLRLRELLEPLNRDGASIKVVEVPPGPPVLSTLVAEVYGGDLVPYERQRAAAAEVMDRLRAEPLVVEVDSTVEHPRERRRFVTDKEKAALSGIATEDINQTLSMANAGLVVSYLQLPHEAAPLPIELRLPVADRADPGDFLRLSIKGRAGIVQESTDAGLDSGPQPLVPLGELGRFESLPADQAIHRKDLRRVVYVTAELNGRTPGEVITDLQADFVDGAEPAAEESGGQRAWDQRSYLRPGGGLDWTVPEGTRVSWSGEGEWRITIRVFRDMGLAFLFALSAILVVLRLQTGSTALALIIMSSIPLTIIGIMPGFWLMNGFGERVVANAPDPVLFTATAMIGMIALAGIVVRNSLILVEFITQARSGGLPLREALLQAGSVRMRPVLLTAGTTLLGNLIITLDPVFSGLALAIIFGIVASTAFTLLVVPVVYLLVFEATDDAESPASVTAPGDSRV